MSKNLSADTAVKLVELLTPLSPEDRQRAVRAALMLMGDEPLPVTKASKNADINDEIANELLPRAKNWIKQNEISAEQLEQVFHIEGANVEIIVADVPGKGNREKSYNAYILVGIAQLLATGQPDFDDKSARALCKNLGCLSEANHSLYLKERGNEFTGSKDKGWTLTAPGLKRGATLIKELMKA